MNKQNAVALRVVYVFVGGATEENDLMLNTKTRLKQVSEKITEWSFQLTVTENTLPFKHSENKETPENIIKTVFFKNLLFKIYKLDSLNLIKFIVPYI